ncbi:MAG: hypothetical protein PHD51_03855 [Patescibacteria group bacterium]|nr:hypothetical protein [Patescibacteria group bacterium]MDD5490894.1 hypothetical protein [Patescibacteria group bacterium]
MKKIIFALSVALFACAPALASPDALSNNKTTAGNSNGQATEEAAAEEATSPTEMVEPATPVEKVDVDEVTSSSETPTASSASGTTNQATVEESTQNAGEDKAIQVQQELQIKARNINELKEIIQTKKLELKEELQNLRENKLKKIYENQNIVREAVHSLLSAENLTGGIGPQISAIAQEFNNSVQSTIQAEEKLQTRNRIIKFFTGGDQTTASVLEQEAEKNRTRIEKLNQLKNECTNCAEEVKTVLQEQIQKVEQEQTRLEKVAKAEQQIKGIWGWVRGLFQK